MCPTCPRPRLLPENARAVRAFLSVDTQMRYAPSGRAVGLDYAGVEAALRIAEPSAKRRARLFADVQVMEQALVTAQAEAAREEREARASGRAGA